MHKLNHNDCIGNSLSSININFNELEYWTNNILLSSDRYYKPLVDFYDFYSNFWKSSINFANSINAAERLTSFSTTVETNSAKFIKPIVIIYPNVFQFNSNNIETHIDTVTTWFNQKYPVKNTNTSKTNFVENSLAYVYIMFYNEEVKINQTGNNILKKTKTVGCVTNDVSVTITCSVTYNGTVTCGRSGNVCGAIAGSCAQTKNATCSYTGGSKTETRTGTANIDQYFKDRSENDNIYTLVMKVEDCEWVLQKQLP